MEQYIGDGANLFIIIVVCIWGFVTALSTLDFLRAKEENPKEE